MVDQMKFLVYIRMYQKNEFLYPEKAFPRVHYRGFSEILSLFNTGGCFNNAIFPKVATLQNLAKLP